MGELIKWTLESHTATFAKQTAECRHELIVLRPLEYDVNSDDDSEAKSLGAIVTSRTCMRNIISHRGQEGDGIFGVTDRTYRLLFWEARPTEQFETLSTLVADYWKVQGEGEYAAWLKANYLSAPWHHRYGTCATPGIIPSHIAIESHRRVIKQTSVTTLQASTATVLNDLVPRTLSHQATKSKRKSGLVILEGKQNAEKYIDTLGDYLFPFAHLYHGLEFQFQHGNASIHTARVASWYLEGQGVDVMWWPAKPPELIPIENALGILSRAVYINGKQYDTKDELVGTITSIREKYRCDCHAFWHNGWVCSHIVSGAVLLKDLTLDVLNARLSARKVSGGQRKTGRPLHWNCLREFASDIDESTETRVEVITTWAERDGTFLWPVHSSSGEDVEMECEELAECVNSAYVIGLDVTHPIQV
ncbi:hypothetical protein PHMEG_00017336 [Phytophthora megakarya]|uniref:SWIM-type domain-containing protein n=1 Tax=Phytophthora megakarya TaxID=4795 RepID=A0A225VY60_9STRA|nr:hypothetical protein PHMEG_00017336 [Phytophthora megakarya]